MQAFLRRSRPVRQRDIPGLGCSSPPLLFLDRMGINPERQVEQGSVAGCRAVLFLHRHRPGRLPVHLLFSPLIETGGHPLVRNPRVRTAGTSAFPPLPCGHRPLPGPPALLTSPPSPRARSPPPSFPFPFLSFPLSAKPAPPGSTTLNAGRRQTTGCPPPTDSVWA